MGIASLTASSTHLQWANSSRSRLGSVMVWLFAALVGVGLSSSVQADLPDFTKLVKNNEAAVVNISTVGEASNDRNSNRPRDPRLEEFYRFFGPPNGRGAPDN
ncbi:MAG: hypothetical protein ISQ65_01170, partial [Pseudomonadales bacterium]|nr:hypothetical protein [Pseudomonadales bacterium]